MSIIAEKVKTLLQKLDFHPIISPENHEVIILTGLNGHNGGQYNIQYVGKDTANDSEAVLLVTTQFPMKIPPNKVEKIMDFLNRLNHEAWFSWLTIENGIITSNSGVHSKTNDSMNDDIIEPCLFAVLGRIDTMHPFIMELIYSEKTVDEVRKEMVQPIK